MYTLEPWGETREDMRMARTVWATLQASRSKSIGSDQKFVFDWQHQKPEKLTPEQYQNKARAAWLNAGGGQNHNGRKNAQ